MCLEVHSSLLLAKLDDDPVKLIMSNGRPTVEILGEF